MGCASEYVQMIGRMMYDEPCVHNGVAFMQARCMRNGLEVRWGNNAPTPSFAAHIRRYFEPFCNEAIAAALAVGFVPYRIRNEAHKIPEVLPLGTYSWSVVRGDTSTTSDKQPSAAGPLLRYAISTSYVSAEDVRIHPYTTPHALFSCTSPLSSLITHYRRLQQWRFQADAAEAWNSRPNLMFEEAEKTFINEMAERGGPIQALAEMDVYATTDAYNSRQHLSRTVAQAVRRDGTLPQDSGVLFAPRNNKTRDISKVSPPEDMNLRELAFTRLTAMALGLPPCVLLQSSSVTSGLSGGGGGLQWVEGPVVIERTIIDSCAPIARMLEALMVQVYREIYKSEPPTFKIHIDPSLAPENLVNLFDTDMMSAPDASRVMKSGMGVSLSSDAASARSERRKAANVLPFRDKQSK